MNREEFKEKLKILGLNQKKFAEISGYGYSTVKGWEVLPKSAEIVLLFIELSDELKTIDQTINTFVDIRQKVYELDLLQQISDIREK